MIDEKELLKKFNDSGIEITFNLPVEEVLGNDVDMDDFSALMQDTVKIYKSMVIDTISKMPKLEGTWFLCSEKMPEERDAMFNQPYFSKISKHVLATIMDEKTRNVIVREAHTLDGEWNCDTLRFNEGCKVIAWMPLPEPYKNYQGE